MKIETLKDKFIEVLWWWPTADRAVRMAIIEELSLIEKVYRGQGQYNDWLIKAKEEREYVEKVLKQAGFEHFYYTNKSPGFHTERRLAEGKLVFYSEDSMGGIQKDYYIVNAARQIKVRDQYLKSFIHNGIRKERV